MRIYQIHRQIYDFSDFVHPGGPEVFEHLKVYTDITPTIYAYHKRPSDILKRIAKYEIDCEIPIQYETNFNYDKYCELKSIVYKYIRENRIPLYWTLGEIIYNIGIVLVHSSIMSHCFYQGAHVPIWELCLAGYIYASGFALIFHELSHYTGLQHRRLRKILAFILGTQSLNVSVWNHNHNYLHHNFTNTKWDVDVVSNTFRHFDYVEYKERYKWQHLYVYPTFLIGGFIRTKSYLGFLNANKIIAMFYFYMFGIKTVFYYMTITFLFLLFANLSHIHGECTGKQTDCFLYNQASSAMNYKTENPIIRFSCIGLDVQLEHHLFPNLPHSSLRRIQHIVRDYCLSNDIPYIEKPHVGYAIYSYLSYLRKMGEKHVS